LRHRVRSGEARATTLNDVARLLGISAATVSRSLSKPDMVSAKTRARVDEAVRKLGYIPHAAARALAGRGHRVVGVVIPSLRFGVFAELVESLQAGLDRAAFGVLLGHTGGEPDREYEQVRALVERGIDAVVLTGNSHDLEVLRLLDDAGLPAICAFDFSADAALPCVGFDNADAAENLAQHLIENGRDGIAMITQPVASNDRARKRVAGVKRALRRIGKAMRPGHLLECDGLLPSSREAMRDLIASGEPPNAVICFSDLIALAAAAECRAAGLRIPDDIAIADFSGVGLSEINNPPLTSVPIPAKDIGRIIGEQLIARLEEGAPLESVRIEHALEIRGSTLCGSLQTFA